MPLPFTPAKWNTHAVLTCAEMRRAETVAAAKGLTTWDMMHKAGTEAAKIIGEKYKPCHVTVMCGPGNNGGDGFVCAEALRQAGWEVTVAAMLPADQMKGDAQRAAKEYQGNIVPLADVVLGRGGLVVVALFGTGLTRPIDGVAKDALGKILQTSMPVVAIDLPSGVDGDTGRILGTAPKAILTITFAHKKIGHLLLPGASQCGEVRVVDIGIGADVMNEVKPLRAENGKDLWLDLYPFPKAEEHKYSHGHALIYGGSVMTGATRLATRAAQRMGVGLVTIGAMPNAVPIYMSALESVIVRLAENTNVWRELIEDPKRNAILVGPGLGVGEVEKELIRAALESKKTCVVDADAFTNFAGKPDDFIALLHDKCILTPHEGEFERIFGTKIDKNLDKLTRARKAAEIAGCTVLLKGADTIIAGPDSAVAVATAGKAGAEQSRKSHAVINTNAPPWLATAGAGDVLAGMILGLAAHKISPFVAATTVAWLHGEIAANFGPGLIAEDLVDGIPAVLKELAHSH